jgi:SAM-dependent methyltransferase
VNAQTWTAGGYAQHARFVAELGMPVLELLAPRPGERILDLGCGDGVLTRKLVELECDVVGVDTSESLALAAGRLGLDVRMQNAEALQFADEFDAVFSNAALHWMKRADAVIDGVFRALKPGGRFVAECGGKGCIRTIQQALEASLEQRGIDTHALSPWYFPSAEEYATRLEQRGFVVRCAELFERPTPLPTGISGWLETFGGTYLKALPADARLDIVREVEAAVLPVLSNASGIVNADYVRLRFAAHKPLVGP